MKIAVVDHVGNHGGGSRVVRALLPALKRLSPGLDMTYFGNPASIRRENLTTEFSEVGISVVHINALRLATSKWLPSDYARRAVQVIQRRWLAGHSWLPSMLTGDVSAEVSNRVRGFDLVFYPWPFMLPFPQVDCPSVGLFHDFNFKYYFGGAFVFTQDQRVQLEREVPDWLERVTPVVSTNFMATELASFYPGAVSKTRVVHLAPLGGVTRIDEALASDVLHQLGVETPYLLYPTHLCTHKNIGPLIGALAKLRLQKRNLTLVLTGAGTEAVQGHASDIGVRLDAHGGSVKGLGYVSNMHMNALIQRAAVVVSPSLYEAGNGPGLDAWGLGAPVAMSNIPAFVEHLEVFGVRAKLFDPRSPQDIAEKIANILDNPDSAQADAEVSRQALQQLTWEHTAKAYLDVFQEAINNTLSVKIASEK